MARRFRASFGGDPAGRTAKILEPAAQLNVRSVGRTKIMRIYNRSNLSVPSELWRDLAERFGVGAELPGAVSDTLGMYRGRQLRVFITTIEHPKNGIRSETGSYTYGEVQLLPCHECSAAFLTTVLLHELYHAFVHQYAPTLYDRVEHCRHAQSFATRAFRALGGRTSKHCFGFALNATAARLKVHRLKLPRTLAGTNLQAPAVQLNVATDAARSWLGASAPRAARQKASRC